MYFSTEAQERARTETESARDAAEALRTQIATSGSEGDAIARIRAFLDTRESPNFSRTLQSLAHTYSNAETSKAGVDEKIIRSLCFGLILAPMLALGSLNRRIGRKEKCDDCYFLLLDSLNIIFRTASDFENVYQGLLYVVKDPNSLLHQEFLKGWNPLSRQDPRSFQILEAEVAKVEAAKATEAKPTDTAGAAAGSGDTSLRAGHGTTPLAAAATRRASTTSSDSDASNE